jgi:hypothetical protein
LLLLTIPLLAAWLLALLSAWACFVTGLYPAFGMADVGLWTLASCLSFRTAVEGKKVWQKWLPVAVFLASVAFHQFGLRFLREQYMHENGFPRRYYKWENK